ncbi:MAG: response regulator [Desulfobacula sp.]|nr:response regulator [Desulfobacula sp.]
MDDEEGFRAAVARRLAKRGLNSLQVSDGAQCLDILGEKPMDVVVLDVKMPGISGIDTLRAIKQAFKKIQVILLTGNVAITDGVEGIKAGAFDYLTKPVEIDHLANKIRQAFEMSRLEEEKQKETEYRTKLEKKMIDTDRLVSLGILSTGVAHEINNPLAIINESAGFMKQVIDTDEMSKFGQKDALMMGIEKIEKSIKRARKITHQLLGHVKKSGSQFTKVNLKTLVYEILGLLKKEITEKQISIHWEIQNDKIIIWSDPYQIRQVLINLLNNAVQALEQNGFISISFHEIKNDVILEIKDNGVGIPKDNLRKIFDPFFSTKSFDEGSGLGLFVVHKIIDGLDGEIEVTSKVGKGTCFKIKLPKKLEKTIRA